ncbi:MAG: phasin family protein [Gammaproteobacteria bacterium]
MYPFSNAVTPAVRSHLDAQVAFLNDVSKSLTRSFQNLVELNIQLGQTLLEENNIASHKLLTVDAPADAISVAAARAQPAAEKLRAYQQHVSRVAADAQVELARVTEEHVQETSRTARTLADEVARVASSETERSIRTQQDTLKNFRDPFQHNGSAHGAGVHASAPGNLQSEGASGSAQFSGPAGDVSVQGNVQGKGAGKAA